MPVAANVTEEIDEDEINVINDKESKKQKPSRKKSSKKAKELKNKELEQDLLEQEAEKNQSLEQILGVFVHYADCLKMDFFVLHPVVKVSLVNLATGKLIAKSDKARKVTSYYEGDHVQHIVQLMTQPYDFKQKRSIIPRWEELLLFNENPDYLKSFTSNWGIFFEVLDFVRMASVNNRDAHANGWHYVAWAFLKPTPSKAHSNLCTRLRLQLYKPQVPVKINHANGESQVWKWWSQCPHVPYPSSLYVTVEPVDPPELAKQATIRSMGPLQPEKGSSSLAGLHHSNSTELKPDSDQLKSPPRVVLWTRLPGQTCKIPDQDLYQLDMAGKGAWCLRFSSDGKHLAVACQSQGLMGSLIKIYFVENGQLESELAGHKGPVYALDWYRNNQLLSASGDGSVRIWSAKCPRKQEAVLQHPTYVYAARFHPNEVEIVATAGYDQVVRIWQKASGSHYIILHELVNHKAFVNCMEFDIDGQVLFTGDSQGAIRVWESSDANDQWYLKKSLDFKEIQASSILNLSIHPGGRRLLVHSTSLANPVIMVDLKLHTIMQNFAGSQSFKGHVSSCITPCGTFVISSSQDGAVYVWNADNGVQVKKYFKFFEGEN